MYGFRRCTVKEPKNKFLCEKLFADSATELDSKGKACYQKNDLVQLQNAHLRGPYTWLPEFAWEFEGQVYQSRLAHQVAYELGADKVRIRMQAPTLGKFILASSSTAQ